MKNIIFIFYLFIFVFHSMSSFASESKGRSFQSYMDEIDIYLEDFQDVEVQFDVQGVASYNKYNFTDLQESYDDMDMWVEFKVSAWLSEHKDFSPFLSVIPSFTTDDDFWWQKYTQFAIGLQWYPFYQKEQWEHFKSVRLFVQYVSRNYYDKEDGQDPEDYDVQLGADYYYDNIFKDDVLTMVLWSKLAYNKTNFSLSEYDAITWQGDAKFGSKREPAATILFPYVGVNWSYVPSHDDRWWENFVRLVPGVRWYPTAYREGGFVEDLFKRFHIFAEVAHNISWLGDSPSRDVEETDYRIGIGFSTQGFYRED